MNSLRNHKKRRRLGLTLIEVVAGLALLSTLLVATLVAYRGHVRQVRVAQQRLDAIEKIDTLMADWSETREYPASGTVEMFDHRNQMNWRLLEVDSNHIRDLNARILRLEVFRPTVSAENTDLVLASVEFLHAQ